VQAGGGLLVCWSSRFERVSPVRGFASLRGSGTGRGWWWFSRTGEHVGYESWVERDVLMALDADPGVEAVASQPMRLHWVSESGKARRHAPDFFARRADGTGVLIDVRHFAGNSSRPAACGCTYWDPPLRSASKHAARWPGVTSTTGGMAAHSDTARGQRSRKMQPEPGGECGRRRGSALGLLPRSVELPTRGMADTRI
jgi:hypothetical protein